MKHYTIKMTLNDNPIDFVKVEHIQEVKTLLSLWLIAQGNYPELEDFYKVVNDELTEVNYSEVNNNANAFIILHK